MLGWLAGCAGPVTPETPASGDASGNAGSGSNGSGGSSGSNGSGGSSQNPGRDEGPPGEEPALPGVDEPFDVAPTGCIGGFAAGALALTLDDTATSVLLEGTAGKLVANGFPCTDADEVEVALGSLTSLSITGDAAENAVILDLDSGDFSALLATPESIELALGAGQNSLLIRGTAGADVYRHGMRGASVVLDLLGDAGINVVAQGVTELGVSLAAGDDELGDLQAARAAAEEAGTLEVPGGAPVTPLSVALTAYGADGADVLLGGSKDDMFYPGPGDDQVDALDGNDIFWASADSDGADTYNGGGGFDQITYELRTLNVSLSACLSTGLRGCVEGECSCTDMSGEPAENDRIVNIEDVTAGLGDDTVRGSALSDSLSGGPGDDTLYGMDGADVLYGQQGSDVFDGGLDGDYCDNQTSEQSTACEL